MIEKFCFLSEVNYPNYVNRFKLFNLKRFLELNLNIPYYVSTNLPEMFEEYKNHPLIKVFDIEELRKNNINSQKNEPLPLDPIGLYPAKYPWNLRRFILEKAASDGFLGLFFIECDTRINKDLNSERILEFMRNLYEPNTVKTSSARFVYKDRHPNQELFSSHQKYIDDLGLNFDDDSYDTLDGTNQLFFARTEYDFRIFFNNWHKITDYGYEKLYGYKTGYLSNLSFVIPLSNFKLIHTDTPFETHHVFEDRYTPNYNNKEPENIPIKKENNLISIFRSYSSKKAQNGFCSLLENYLESISNNNPNILEIGVGTISLEPPPGRQHVPENMYSYKELNPNYSPGNSLRALRDFLKTGNLYGVDIQKDCLIDEDRIKTFIFDSRSSKNTSNLTNVLKFNLIIDDSDKDPNIRIITFNNFYSSLDEGGYYVIEELLDAEFLSEYFSHNSIPHIIIDNFLIINKKNNFDIISNKKEISEKLVEKKQISYDLSLMDETMFSIDGNILAKKGFYINLERSKERKENVERISNLFNIQGLIRFDALTDEMIQYSCTKSHLGVFDLAMKNNLDTIFVAEDDFDISEDLFIPNSEPIKFRDKIKQIKIDLENLDWDVFLFGCNPKSHIIPLTNNVGIINRSTGAWAYLIKRRAYEYLLKNLNYKRDYIAIDDYLPILNDVGFKSLTSIPLTIGHAVGYVSTLQPRGPVNYTEWIIGNYYKFLFNNYKNNNFVEDNIEKKLTICIPGFFCDNYLFYLKYALKSLPDDLKKCKFLIRFDTKTKNADLSDFIKLQAYFRDVKGELNVTLTHGFGGLIASFDYFLKTVQTQYFMMFEFDYVFLHKNKIDFKNILKSFDNHNFINSVYLSGDDISVRGFDLCSDKNGKVTPFEIESRVSEAPLVTTTRWSNRPGIHRLSKMKEWFDKYMKNEHIGILHQSCFGIEDAMIPVYQKTISESNWDDIKDDWGTYLYGNLGDGPFVGHTDSSKRYQNEIKSTLEINADIYVLEHPLDEND